MADAPGTPPWLDLLDEDIPVVDKSGKQLLVKGLDFVERGAPKPAAPPPATPAAAVPAPPQNLPLMGQAPPPAAPALEPQPKATRADFGLDADKDAADIKKIEAIMIAKTGQTGATEKKAEETILDSMVDQAVNGTGVALPDEDMRRRYRMLISLFFRDLRDGLETKSKFTMPTQSGGMGMADDEADRVMAELRKRNDDYHAAMSGRAADDKAKYVAAQTEKVLGAQDALDKKDQERMDQAFTGLLQKTGVKPAAGAPEAAPPAPKEPKVVTVVGIDAQGKAIVAAPAQPASSVPPAPASAPSSPQPAAAPGAKTLVADVKYSPKLTGPVEELRQLMLKDFRRLSRDPREATLKIKDKIDLLEEQSFDIKTQGIKAWHESEVNKLYLDILRTSLEGKPITEVIADLENKALPFLNKAEFDAIMELNRKLRFG